MPTRVRLISALVMAAVAAIFCVRVYFLLDYYWYWEDQFLLLIPVYCCIAAFGGAFYIANSADNFARASSDAMTFFIVFVVAAIIVNALGMLLFTSIYDNHYKGSMFLDQLVENLMSISKFLLDPLLIVVLAGGSVMAGFFIHRSAY